MVTDEQAPQAQTSGDGDSSLAPPAIADPSPPTAVGVSTPPTMAPSNPNNNGPLPSIDAGPAGPTGPPFVPPIVEAMPDDTGCLRDSAKRRRLDLYLLFDRAFGLPFPDPFDVIDEGLRDFVDDGRSEGTGVALLTLSNQCDESGYPAPDVDWGLLPGHASKIKAGIPPLAVNFNFTQAEPALRAAIRQARDRALQHPEWEQALVVVTDGFDFGICLTSTASSTEQAVRDGVTKNPSIATYVVALGTSTQNPLTSFLGGVSLPDLARIGGSQEAHLVRIDEGSEPVTEALNQVRIQAQPCHYEIPVDAEGDVGLALRDMSGGLPEKQDASDCGRDHGFYLGSVDATNYLMLCPATCERVKQDTEWGHYGVFVRTCP